MNISASLLLSAGDNSRLPKSPAGFIVQAMLQAGIALAEGAAGSSANVKLLPPRPASRTEFRRSRTAGPHKLASSSSKIPPEVTDSSSGPGCQQKAILRRFFKYLLMFW